MRNLSLRFASISVFLSMGSLPVLLRIRPITWSSRPHQRLGNSCQRSQSPSKPSPQSNLRSDDTTPTYDAWSSAEAHHSPRRQGPAAFTHSTRGTLLLPVNLAPQPSGCVWQAQVAGVIYADGTYDGQESAYVTSRQDERHRGGLQYWTNAQLAAMSRR